MNKLQKSWNKDFVRFLFVGGLNTLLGIIYYNILVQFMSYGYAITVGYILGIITSYLLNSWIVFRESPMWHKLTQFPIVYLIQYLVSLFVTYVGVEYLDINEQMAYIIAIAVTVPITFTISRLIIVAK